MTRRTQALGLATMAVCLGVTWVVPVGPVAAQSSPGNPGTASGEVLFTPPPRATDVALADSTLRRAVRRLEQGRPAGSGVQESAGRIRVEVLHHLDAAAAEALIARLGGTVDGTVPGALSEGLVPADRLEELEASPGVDFVRPPLPASEPAAEPAVLTPAGAEALAGQEVVKTRASAWHAAGRRGAGVRVGIVDYFNGTAWDLAFTSADVSGYAGTFCRQNGASCDIWNTSEPHGVAVAEIVHEMAPDASLYLATVASAADLQAAVDYFAANGVTIITRSLTSAYDGPGDGTGPMATVINSAVAQGMTWFQSAGNSAGSPTQVGRYWRGRWVDADGDGYLEFPNGKERLAYQCGFINGLRWNDFGAGGAATDYDVYVFDTDPTLAQTNPDGWALGDQAAGALPIERPPVSCVGNDTDYLVVYRFSAGNGSGNDVLEFMSNRPIEAGLWSSPYSASGPAADSASAGAVVVGAIDPAAGTTIAGYSSQGPTNDGRVKPDLSAASCVLSNTYSPGCFNGTSAATPVVAGAAALVRGAGLATTPAALRTWLLANATVERGVAGTDNVYGRGELILPVYQPDNTIRYSSDSTYVGDNIYSSTAPGQTRSALIRRGAGGTFYVHVQNDGNRSDRFRIAGTGSSSAGYTVRYLSGTTDITSAVVAGTYNTASLAPGALVTITMQVSVASFTTNGRNILVTSISAADGTKRDRVSAVITPFS